MNKIALISGLWSTKDENGLIDLATQQNAPYKVFHYNDSIDDLFKYQPTVCHAHSFGNRMVLDMLRKYPYFILELWNLIDPVSYGWDWFDASKNFTIPVNVLKANCFRRVRPWFPAPSSLILNPIPGKYTNYLDIEMSHANAPRNELVQSTILKSLG